MKDELVDFPLFNTNGLFKVRRSAIDELCKDMNYPELTQKERKAQFDATVKKIRALYKRRE